MGTVIDTLRDKFGDSSDIREKAYLAVGIMEQHCHMIMNNDLYRLDADVMRSMAIKAVLSVLKGEK